MTRLDNILVPTDFLPHSARALALAICVGRLAGATVHVLLAYSRPVRSLTPGEILIPGDSFGTSLDGTLHRLETLVRQIEAAGLEGKYHAVEGRAGQVILSVAQEIPADLIAMGTEGRGGFSRLVAGSIAEHTVRCAPCPVLTVSGRAADEPRAHRLP